VETPPEIAFIGMEPSDQLRDLVDEEVERLEEFFGRITSCRVSVKAPDGNKRTGGIYEPRIFLALPDGREVSSTRNPPKDERHADPALAIRDAFRAARRQLQDEARKLRGDVKHHEPPPSGVVRKLFSDDGYGFIESTDGREFYFHRNSVLGDAFDGLEEGDLVTFAEEMGEKGPQASTVRVQGGHGMRSRDETPGED
jgi:cold shock CspA family protein